MRADAIPFGMRLQILAISGSLRAASSNATLLRALPLLASPDMNFVLYDGLGDLPHFNPDMEDPAPPAVARFQSLLAASDGVLIPSPEYAHGVPGAMKNALDWVVGSGELVDKPVALLNASPASTYAQAQLTETLRVMTANLIFDAFATVPMKGARFTDEAAVVAHVEVVATLRAALVAFAEAIHGARDAGRNSARV